MDRIETLNFTGTFVFQYIYEKANIPSYRTLNKTTELSQSHRCREAQPFCFSPQQHPLLAYEVLRWKEEVLRESVQNSLSKSLKHGLV